MSIIKAGHFGFIVGDTPVGTTDTSTWAAIRGVAEQLNTNCASSIPPGQSLGGIQRAGKTEAT